MPKIKIDVKGDIISDRQQRFYDWLDIAGTSPAKVVAALPKVKSDVEVVINSGGGDVSAASEIYTALKEYEGHVTVKIVGVAASAASVIAMSGDTVLMAPTALMMIHNASVYVGRGDRNTFGQTMEVLKIVDEAISNAYRAKTGKTQEDLLALMDKESWFNAEKAISEGFADEVLSFEKDEQLEQYVASQGSTFLHADAIEKLEALLDAAPTEPPNHIDQFENADMVLFGSRLRLLKMKGENLQ